MRISDWSSDVCSSDLTINDSHGHLAGDDCLREVAKRIRGTVNDERHVIARFSGEEFVILSPCNDWDEAYHIAEGLRQQFAASPIACQGTSMTISVSIGDRKSVV